MQNYKIEILISNIANAVYRITANAESERGDNLHVATEDNATLIQAFVDNSIHLLDEAVERYGAVEVIGDSVIVDIDMPSNWAAETEQLKDAVRVFLENYAIARWFELSGTADRYNEAAVTALARVTRMLEKRIRPIR